MNKYRIIVSLNEESKTKVNGKWAIVKHKNYQQFANKVVDCWYTEFETVVYLYPVTIIDYFVPIKIITNKMPSNKCGVFQVCDLYKYNQDICIGFINKSEYARFIWNKVIFNRDSAFVKVLNKLSKVYDFMTFLDLCIYENALFQQNESSLMTYELTCSYIDNTYQFNECQITKNIHSKLAKFIESN